MMNKHQLKKIIQITNRAQFNYGTIPGDHVQFRLEKLDSEFFPKYYQLTIHNIGAHFTIPFKHVVIQIGPRGGVCYWDGVNYRRSLILG